jgi:hypothetical protein
VHDTISTLPGENSKNWGAQHARVDASHTRAFKGRRGSIIMALVVAKQIIQFDRTQDGPSAGITNGVSCPGSLTRAIPLFQCEGHPDSETVVVSACDNR